MLTIPALLTLSAVAFFQATAPTGPSAGPDCDFIKRKIDCSRLTAQECEAQQLAQDRYNLNVQNQCNRAAAAAAGGGGGGGGGGGAGGGAGSGAGGGSGSSSGASGSAGQSSSTSEQQAQQQAEQQGAETQPSAEQQNEQSQGVTGEQISTAPPVSSTTRDSGSRAPKADLGSSSPLCNTAQKAYREAKTDQQRESMQAMVDKYCN